MGSIHSPITLCSSQLRSLPIGSAADHESPAPAPDAWPPQHGAGDGKHQDEDRRPRHSPGGPFSPPSRFTCRSSEPCQKLDRIGTRLAEIFACVGIEQPFLAYGRCGPARCRSPDWAPGWKSCVPDPAQLVLRDRRAARLREARWWVSRGAGSQPCVGPGQSEVYSSLRKTMALPRDADHQHVQAERDAGPEMNLEQRLANPDAFRTPQPSLPGIHAAPPLRMRMRNRLAGGLLNNLRRIGAHASASRRLARRAA